MLASDEKAGGFLSGVLEGTLPRLASSAPGASPVGRHIGPYRVLSEIGHGGMGAVYRAVRDDDQYQKQVAIKLLREGTGSELVIERFKAERQILANWSIPTSRGSSTVGRRRRAGNTSQWNASMASPLIAIATRTTSQPSSGWSCSSPSARRCSTRIRGSWSTGT